MKKLTDSEVVDLMREEWDIKVSTLLEDVGVTFEADVEGDKQPIISPDLKIVHKKSGIKYTVDSVGPNDVMVRNPEGEKFLLDAAEFEKEYQLD